MKQVRALSLGRAGLLFSATALSSLYPWIAGAYGGARQLPSVEVHLEALDDLTRQQVPPPMPVETTPPVRQTAPAPMPLPEPYRPAPQAVMPPPALVPMPAPSKPAPQTGWELGLPGVPQPQATKPAAVKAPEPVKPKPRPKPTPAPRMEAPKPAKQAPVKEPVVVVVPEAPKAKPAPKVEALPPPPPMPEMPEPPKFEHLPPPPAPEAVAVPPVNVEKPKTQAKQETPPAPDLPRIDAEQKAPPPLPSEELIVIDKPAQQESTKGIVPPLPDAAIPLPEEPESEAPPPPPVAAPPMPEPAPATETFSPKEEKPAYKRVIDWLVQSEDEPEEIAPPAKPAVKPAIVTPSPAAEKPEVMEKPSLPPLPDMKPEMDAAPAKPSKVQELPELEELPAASEDARDGTFDPPLPPLPPVNDLKPEPAKQARAEKKADKPKESPKKQAAPAKSASKEDAEIERMLVGETPPPALPEVASSDTALPPPPPLPGEEESLPPLPSADGDTDTPPPLPPVPKEPSKESAVKKDTFVPVKEEGVITKTVSTVKGWFGKEEAPQKAKPASIPKGELPPLPAAGNSISGLPPIPNEMKGPPSPKAKAAPTPPVQEGKLPDLSSLEPEDAKVEIPPPSKLPPVSDLFDKPGKKPVRPAGSADDLAFLEGKTETASPPEAPPASGTGAGTHALLFKPTETTVPLSEEAALSALATRIQSKADARVTVTAYAGGDDAQASAARRVSLSRALSVRSFLIDKGVASTAITVRTMGNKHASGAPDRVDIEWR
jgi:outer membrane protein OmpA-like peptidoglycan-associated protein